LKIPKKDMLALFDHDPLMGYRVLSYLIRVVGFRFQQFQEELTRHKGHDIMHSW